MLCWALGPCAALEARGAEPGICPRPAPESAVVDPEDLRSRDGVLTVDLSVHNEKRPDGSVRYCYLAADGAESPTLRVRPGDLLVLHLRNELKQLPAQAAHMQAPDVGMPPSHRMTAKHADPCTSGMMTIVSTNLHFHGLTVPPVCHQDDVLRTSIQPSDPTFEYRMRIPDDEPPGLYWYHPHIHGFTTRQVLGGASGALIVEGIERADAELANLPERVLVIRDQDLLNPDAPPSKSEPVVPKMLIDRDGDAANNGTGFGKPAKDLSVNFVPVPYPDYPPARLRMRPGERQLWRVLNASAVTYLNLALLFGDRPQTLGIVALDGVPLGTGGGPGPPILWRDRIGVPPGARVEFIVTGPPAGVPALLVTRTVDTGQGGENDPNRALASITTGEAEPEPPLLPSAAQPLPVPEQTWLGNVPPVRVRKLYFSEKLSNPDDPNSATTFFLTVDGQAPAPFDPTVTEPNLIVRHGEVEDWIVENRSTELHAFHIHQIHFLLLDWNGFPIDEPFLRDTVNVPYYNGRSLTYPSVRLRMDFRGRNTVGTFVYHCHLLEHEDGGMMGTIEVLPAGSPSSHE
jgi:FtsP/CotA-like multicopper oxidase with cupredoxin domain